MYRKYCNIEQYKSVTTNFYWLVFSTEKSKNIVLALETQYFGPNFGVNYKIALKFASHYGVKQECILALASGDIHILLGIDSLGLTGGKSNLLIGPQTPFYCENQVTDLALFPLKSSHPPT